MRPSEALKDLGYTFETSVEGYTSVFFKDREIAFGKTSADSLEPWLYQQLVTIFDYASVAEENAEVALTKARERVQQVRALLEKARP